MVKPTIDDRLSELLEHEDPAIVLRAAAELRRRGYEDAAAAKPSGEIMRMVVHRDAEIGIIRVLGPDGVAIPDEDVWPPSDDELELLLVMLLRDELLGQPAAVTEDDRST